MAKAIVETFEAEVAPPRLALGQDVYGYIKAALTSRLDHLPYRRFRSQRERCLQHARRWRRAISPFRSRPSGRPWGRKASSGSKRYPDSDIDSGQSYPRNRLVPLSPRKPQAGGHGLRPPRCWSPSPAALCSSASVSLWLGLRLYHSRPTAALKRLPRFRLTAELSHSCGTRGSIRSGTFI